MRTRGTATGIRPIGFRPIGLRAAALVALASALAACGGQPQGEQHEDASSQAESAPASSPEAAPGASGATPANTPPAAFAQCMSCHAIQPGRNGIGPSLAGIAGHKAASVPGFAYSPALTAANLTWDRPTLDRWLTAPMKTVPGTRMIYAGMSDPVRRKEVIDYLETLK